MLALLNHTQKLIAEAYKHAALLADIGIERV